MKTHENQENQENQEIKKSRKSGKSRKQGNHKKPKWNKSADLNVHAYTPEKVIIMILNGCDLF